MNTRNRFIPTVIVAALIALCLPALAAAQGTYDPYGRPDYRRNRDDDYRNNDYRNNNSRFGDGRNLNRSENEARRVFDLASQMGRVIRRNALYDNRVANDWSQVQQELNIIGDAYGYRVNDYNNNGRYNPRNNNDNDYWWRRLPRP